jgi:hypothetical protein
MSQIRILARRTSQNAVWPKFTAYSFDEVR